VNVDALDSEDWEREIVHFNEGDSYRISGLVESTNTLVHPWCDKLIKKNAHMWKSENDYKGISCITPDVYAKVSFQETLRQESDEEEEEEEESEIQIHITREQLKDYFGSDIYTLSETLFNDFTCSERSLRLDESNRVELQSNVSNYQQSCIFTSSNNILKSVCSCTQGKQGFCIHICISLLSYCHDETIEKAVEEKEEASVNNEAAPKKRSLPSWILDDEKKTSSRTKKTKPKKSTTTNSNAKKKKEIPKIVKKKKKPIMATPEMSLFDDSQQDDKMTDDMMNDDSPIEKPEPTLVYQYVDVISKRPGEKQLFKNKTFYLCGDLSGSIDKMKLLLNKHGGKLVSHVSKASYVISEPTYVQNKPSCIKRAFMLDIPIVHERFLFESIMRERLIPYKNHLIPLQNRAPIIDNSLSPPKATKRSRSPEIDELAQSTSLKKKKLNSIDKLLGHSSKLEDTTPNHSELLPKATTPITKPSTSKYTPQITKNSTSIEDVLFSLKKPSSMKTPSLTSQTAVKSKKSSKDEKSRSIDDVFFGSGTPKPKSTSPKIKRRIVHCTKRKSLHPYWKPPQK